jgi:hypothetical protein
MMAGTQKREIRLIQLVNRALAQSAAVMEERKLPQHVATGRRGRANKVDMFVGKTGMWYQNGGWMELDVSVDIVPLAEQQTRPGH